MTRRHLGDYTILKQIGQGSLGNVYLAEHRFMKRQYAIKELPEELSQDKSFIARFEEEVGQIAALNHEHIIRIHNISYADGCYFLVMDCVVDELGETTNFAQYMAGQKNPLLEEDLHTWMMQLAEALDYAHSRPGGQSMIHRGLKLNNVLVGRNDQGKQGLYIADFGLSRIIGMGTVLSRIYQSLMHSLEVGNSSESSPSSEQRVDKLQRVHNSFLQSYAFLAPEQKNLSASLEGQNKVDTYAFGILIYYAMTKKFPEGVFDMPGYIVPHYRKNWDQLITQCLQADPAKRPESLVDAMNNLLEEKKSSSNLSESIEQIGAMKHKEVEAVKKEQVIEKVEAAVSVSKPKFKDVTMLNAEETSALLNPKPAAPKPVLQQGEIQRPSYDPDPGAIFKMETKVTHYQPKKDTEVKNIEPILTEMTVIKEGSFLRGSKDGNRDEMPQHKVHLKSFAIDIHPVTNEQFVRFLDAMGGEKDVQNNDMIRLKESRIKRSGGASEY